MDSKPSPSQHFVGAFSGIVHSTGAPDSLADPPDQKFCTVLLDGPTDRITLSADMVNTALLAKGAIQVDNCLSVVGFPASCLWQHGYLTTNTSECLSTVFSNDQEDVAAFIPAAYITHCWHQQWLMAMA